VKTGDCELKIPARVYRLIGAPQGTTLYWDQPLVVAAYELSRLTGKPEYKESAARYIDAFLDRCVDGRGMFAWGNHQYYDAIKEETVKFSGGWHELRPIPPAWGLFWQHDRQKCAQTIRTMVGFDEEAQKYFGQVGVHDGKPVTPAAKGSSSRRKVVSGLPRNASLRVGWWSGISVSCTNGSRNRQRTGAARLWILGSLSRQGTLVGNVPNWYPLRQIDKRLSPFPGRTTGRHLRPRRTTKKSWKSKKWAPD